MESYATAVARVLKQFTRYAPLAESLDDRLARVVADAVASLNREDYDRFAFEELISDASQLLDRCLAYRREYQELAATAIRNLLDNDLFVQARASRELLDTAPWIEATRAAELSMQTAAEVAFSKDHSPLGAGFAATARGGKLVANTAIQGEVTRKAGVADRWTIESDHQQRLAEQFNEQGHILNFADRAERVLNFLNEDLFEAVQKLAVASDGIQEVYGARAVKPRTYETSRIPLDDSVDWVRGQVRWLEKKKQEEVESHIVISLRNGVRVDPAKRDAPGIPIAPEMLKTHNSGFYLRIDLTASTSASPNGYEFVRTGRVRAVGISLGVATTGNITDVRLLRTEAEIRPPTQTLAGQGPGLHRFDTRPQVYLQNITLYSPQEIPEMYSGEAVRNISPAGVWKIQFREMNYPAANQGITWDKVVDVFLHIVVVGQSWPDPSLVI